MRKCYLDNAATTPMDEEVLKAMLPYFEEHFGNPSSLHSFGQRARTAVENAREKVASFLGAKPQEVVFTSGGTESNNFAVKGVARANRKKGDHIVTSAIEHHAVTEPCRFLEEEGFRVTSLPVDSQGLLDPDDVAKAITDKTILISVMHANNEIGTIQPIAEIGKIAKEKEIYFHTDAVQTFGHIPFTVDELNIDLLSLSAHKLNGPKGVGAIYLRSGTRIDPFLQGGEQEENRRASTHNVPGIVGLGKAVERARINMDKEILEQKSLRDKLIKGILERIDGTSLNGHPTCRLPNNIHISIEAVQGDFLVLILDLMGIACSAGAACSSTSVDPSHVLLATGLSREAARRSLRFSVGRYTTEDDIDYLLEVLPSAVKRFRAMSPADKNTLEEGCGNRGIGV